jgi:putative ABC transport system permease protein
MLTIYAGFDRTLDLSFSVVDRSDVFVSFTMPVSEKTIFELRRIPGVLDAEPVRHVPVILRNGLRNHQGAITGLPDGAKLNRAIDKDIRGIEMPEDGAVIATSLADKLDLAPGDRMTVEVREGRQPIIEIPVVAIAETLFGSPAYMDLTALNNALRQDRRVTGAFLKVDGAQQEAIFRALRERPTVAGMSLKSDARNALVKVMNTGVGAARFVMSAIAFIITFGIVYIAARVAQAERARDLASLRVIGFHTGETGFVLLGEIAVVTLIALPLGVLMGQFFAIAVARGFSTDIYQIPAIFTPRSNGFAAMVVIAAAIASGWLVKRDLDRDDLVSTLKTRE